jgi:predicted dehydrogenase
MTLAPGHFHAALVQKRMLPGIARRSYVYAPLDADLVAHLDRLTGFNARPDDPTAWEIDVRAGTDYLDRFLREQPGNTVVLSGRNRPKIDLMLAAVGSSLHVLADKPWVVEAADLPKLEQLLRDADTREVLVWDVMTERHEVTSRLQRELLGDREVFGDWQAGTPDQPALTLESVHHLKKTVSGRPLRRPWWWFDPTVTGDAMADVGAHLADLAMWLVAPDRPVDHRTDVQILDADRWPLVLAPGQFAELTGLPDYPPELSPRTADGQLYYAGNNTVVLALCGVHVRLTTVWDYESPGGDVHQATARGTRSTVAVRQDPTGLPELSVTAADPQDHPKLLATLLRKCDDWQRAFPGVSVEDQNGRLDVIIPTGLRTGHEAHFAEVMAEFVRYFHTPRAVPPWERTNVFTKYFITTRAVELARLRRQF